MNENNKFSERLLKNTQELIFLYNTNREFKERFDKLVTIPKITFKGQILRTYVKVIATVSPRYRHFEKEIRRSSAKYGELLTSYYKDQREYSKLLQNLQNIKAGKYNLPFAQEELKLMQELEKMPDDEKKLSENDKKKKEEIITKIHGYIDQKIAAKDQEEEKRGIEQKPTKGLTDIHGQPLKIYTMPASVPPTPAISFPRFYAPKFPIPSFVKNLASSGQILTRKVIYRFGANIFSGAVGGIVGAGFAGPTGFLVGSLGGGFLPTAIKSGALKGLIGGGGKALVGAGAKAGLVATGVGAPIAATLMILESKKARQTIIYMGAAIGAVIFIFLFKDINETGVFWNPASIGEAAEIPGGSSLNYFIPFRDSSVRVGDPQAVKDKVKQLWPNAKLENWDTIVSQSITNGWNPAFVLTLWIEETGAQGKASYSDPLGCDPKHPTTDINVSLNCLFRNFPVNKYPNNKFNDFMCVYGGDGFHLAPCIFETENPDFPGNIKNWYSILVSSGPGVIINITPTPPSSSSPPQTEFALTCPIANEYNTCSDRYDPIDPCHCNPELGYDPLSMASCKNYPALNYGIDVGTKASKTVLIPYVVYQGETTPQNITCQLITEEDPTCPKPDSGCEWQQTLHYSCPIKNNTLYLLYSHIKSNGPIKTGPVKKVPSIYPQTVSSGQTIGEVANYGSGLRRLNIQVGVGGDCTGSNTSVCKRGGDYFQCPLKKDYVLDY